MTDIKRGVFTPKSFDPVGRIDELIVQNEEEKLAYLTEMESNKAEF